jgi:hypothetical protein
MMLQEIKEQLQDLELLIQDMQNSSDEHAAALLTQLRTGVPISQLMERHERNLYDRRAQSRGAHYQAR